jgi:actin-related protein 9
MAQLYAANTLSGVVVDIGHDRTDITPICEGFVVNEARTTTGVGIRDCQAYLAQLLRTNQSVMAALSSADPEALDATLAELAKKIWEDGLVKVPSDGQTAESPADDDGVTDIAAIVVAGRERQVIEAGTKKKANAKASAAEQARAKEIEAIDLVTIRTLHPFEPR